MIATLAFGFESQKWGCLESEISKLSRAWSASCIPPVLIPFGFKCPLSESLCVNYFLQVEGKMKGIEGGGPSFPE